MSRVLLLCLMFCTAPLRADDWPQFLGPNRDSKSAEKGLLQTFPKEGPKVLWQREAGAGSYASPVIAGDRLILFHRVDNEDRVECLDAATGKEKWVFKYPTSYSDQLGKGDGPRSTPLIAGQKVYTLAADGRLHCLELQTGKKVWMRDLNRDYRVPQSYFGVGTSPILEGDRLILNVGGRVAGIVALDRDTGKEIWKSTTDRASYSSPVAATIDGVRHVLFFTRTNLLGLDPADGKVRYSRQWWAGYDASVNASPPVVVGDQVLVSASYETGSLMVQVKKDSLKEIWSGDGLSSHFSNLVQHDGYLYGFDGRQERGGRLRCLEWKSGKVMWTKDGLGCGTLLFADGQLIVLSERGELLLLEPSGKEYREKARAKVLKGTCRAHLALSSGRLYARDDGKLVCWQFRKE